MFPRHRTVSIPITGLALIAALLSGCGSEETPSSATMSQPGMEDSAGTERGERAGTTVTVAVSGDTFAPAELIIGVGDTVTWVFGAGTPHGVQGIGDKAMGINSPLLEQGEWSHTFSSAGTYRYLCPLHPKMRGTVTVA